MGPGLPGLGDEQAHPPSGLAVVRGYAPVFSREALASNISEEALPIINRFVDGLVADAADRNRDLEDDDGLAGFTATLCALTSGNEAAAALWSP